MQYKKKTKGHRKLDSIRSRARAKIGKLLAENPDMSSSEAKHQVQSEVREKTKIKNFRI